MTQKHFIVIAETIKVQKGNLEAQSAFWTEPQRLAARNVLLETVYRLAAVFGNDNPKFNRQTFVSACGF